MNNRGLVFLYTYMLGMLIIVLGIAFATPIKQVIDDSMNSNELTCSSPASDFDQALCWTLDILKFAYTGFVVFIGLAIMVARRYII